jgi:hypothetical protein
MLSLAAGRGKTTILKRGCASHVPLGRSPRRMRVNRQPQDRRKMQTARGNVRMLLGPMCAPCCLIARHIESLGMGSAGAYAAGGHGTSDGREDRVQRSNPRRFDPLSLRRDGGSRRENAGMSANSEVTYTLGFAVSRYRRHKNSAYSSRGQVGNPAQASRSIPRIARLMALVIRFERLLMDEMIQNYAELARLGCVTRSPITQIMKLLDLAPDIQEEILFLPPIKGLNERSLRSIVSRTDWDEQRRLFQKIREGHSLRPGI